MKNVAAVTVTCVLTAWSLIANAEDAGKQFTLQGRDSYQSSQACYLYVDQFGLDTRLPWPNKFFAVVRTSFEPKRPIFLVAQNRFEMTSVNKVGRPTAELKVWIKAPANEQALLQASDFHGMSRLPLQRFSCVRLHPVESESAK